MINKSVKYSCSGHTADITSAQAMFAAYCAMNNGTTSFPKPSNPPGDSKKEAYSAAVALLDSC